MTQHEQEIVDRIMRANISHDEAVLCGIRAGYNLATYPPRCRIAWNIGGVTGQTEWREYSLLPLCSESLNKQYGAGTHWVEYERLVEIRCPSKPVAWQIRYTEADLGWQQCDEEMYKKYHDRKGFETRELYL